MIVYKQRLDKLIRSNMVLILDYDSLYANRNKHNAPHIHNTYNHIDMDRKPSSVVRNQCQHVIIIYMHCFLSVLITISQQNEIVISISQQNKIAAISK